MVHGAATTRPVSTTHKAQMTRREDSSPQQKDKNYPFRTTFRIKKHNKHSFFVNSGKEKLQFICLNYQDLLTL